MANRPLDRRGKAIRLSVSVTPAQYEAIARIAEVNRDSLARAVRDAIEFYIHAKAKDLTRADKGAARE